MRKILLTSTGFKNKKFKNLFLEEIGKLAKDIKVIFVPTAAISDEAKAMLPFCYKDLIDAGIHEDNIYTYELDYLLQYEKCMKYDAIYFCGGNSRHLLNSINECGFDIVLKEIINNGVFYIGVSAGSTIGSSNQPDNLGFINGNLHVHCKSGSLVGCFLEGSEIYLTDNQAIWICEDKLEVIE